MRITGRKDLVALAGGALAVLAAALVVVLSVGRSSADPGTGRRAVADATVGGLLAGVSLPRPASGIATAAVPGSVRASGSTVVDRTQAWTVARPFSTVRRWVLAHPPAGTRLRSEHSMPGPANASLRFAIARPRSGVAAAEVTIDLATRARGQTVVRADAAATWRLTRPATERVPAGVTEIELVTRAAGRRPTASARITDPARIAAIGRLLDALPVVQPTTMSCPGRYAATPRATLTFRARAGGPVLARAAVDADVREPTTACDALDFSVRGRAMTPLLRGARFLHAVQRLTGVKLTAPPFAA